MIFSTFHRRCFPVLLRVQQRLSTVTPSIESRLRGLFAGPAPILGNTANISAFRQVPPTSTLLQSNPLAGSGRPCKLPVPTSRQYPGRWLPSLSKRMSSIPDPHLAPLESNPPHGNVPPVRESHTSTAASNWFPGQWKLTETGNYIRNESHVVYDYLRGVQKFHRFLLWAMGCITGLSVAVLYNWDVVKQRVGQEGAEVIREGIKSENLQLSAADFSKILLSDILRDDKLVEGASQWFLRVLQESKTDLSSLVVQVLQTQPVLDEVKRVSDYVVQYLCSQQWVQEQVGELLVASISTEYSRNAAGEWVVDLLCRDDVVRKVQDVVNHSVLNEPSVRTEATELASAIVSAVLNDPRTIQLSQDHLSAVMNTPEFQDEACGAAWKIMRKTFAPRWLLTGTSPGIIPAATSASSRTTDTTPSTPAPISYDEEQFDGAAGATTAFTSDRQDEGKERGNHQITTTTTPATPGEEEQQQSRKAKKKKKLTNRKSVIEGEDEAGVSMMTPSDEDEATTTGIIQDMDLMQEVVGTDSLVV